ncbi:unnamed protein product [Prorocentrum cordatum]|uniref:Uncharacterized protein n=1 Tax=Prorocentrum cordatum TaxID=2364126 RepID=A0ABN9QI75_9DINO|nr:unnamed protein product [Polarella glacialis]
MLYRPSPVNIRQGVGAMMAVLAALRIHHKAPDIEFQALRAFQMVGHPGASSLQRLPGHVMVKRVAQHDSIASPSASESLPPQSLSSSAGRSSRRSPFCLAKRLRLHSQREAAQSMCISVQSKEAVKCRKVQLAFRCRRCLRRQPHRSQC